MYLFIPDYSLNPVTAKTGKYRNTADAASRPPQKFTCTRICTIYHLNLTVCCRHHIYIGGRSDFSLLSRPQAQNVGAKLFPSGNYDTVAVFTRVHLVITGPEGSTLCERT